jgi:hypothetical protein
VGNDYPGQERAIEELSALSDDAKEFLSHHICNSLSAILGGIRVGRLQLAEEAAWHIVSDLEKAGIRKTFFRANLKSG